MEVDFVYDFFSFSGLENKPESVNVGGISLNLMQNIIVFLLVE